jgi:hypothetical protein
MSETAIKMKVGFISPQDMLRKIIIVHALQKPNGKCDSFLEIIRESVAHDMYVNVVIFTELSKQLLKRNQSLVKLHIYRK